MTAAHDDYFTTPTPGDLSALLDEVRRHFTRDDDLPDNLLSRIDAALSALPAAGGERTPDGYHYVYLDPFGSGEEVIVHNSGGEWNGQKPRHALPYYYTTPQPSAAEGEGEPALPWRGINECPDSDDLFWFMRGDTIDGPRPPAPDDADYWDWFAPCEAPSFAAPAAGKGVDDAMRRRAREWLAANNGYWDGDYVERLLQAILPPDALTRQPVAGDGMVLVPKEPTDSMLAAAKRFQCDHDTMSAWMEFCGQDAIGQYKAMLAAAPAATPTDGGEGWS